MTKNGTKDGDQRAAIELSCSGDMERGGQKNEVKVLSVGAFSPFVKLSLQRGSNSLPNRLWPHLTFTIMVYFCTISETALLCPSLPYNKNQ
jgi:hypothetical protein